MELDYTITKVSTAYSELPYEWEVYTVPGGLRVGHGFEATREHASQACRDIVSQRGAKLHTPAPYDPAKETSLVAMHREIAWIQRH